MVTLGLECIKTSGQQQLPFRKIFCNSYYNYRSRSTSQCLWTSYCLAARKGGGCTSVWTWCDAVLFTRFKGTVSWLQRERRSIWMARSQSIKACGLPFQPPKYKLGIQLTKLQYSLQHHEEMKAWLYKPPNTRQSSPCSSQLLVSRKIPSCQVIVLCPLVWVFCSMLAPRTLQWTPSASIRCTDSPFTCVCMVEFEHTFLLLDY